MSSIKVDIDAAEVQRQLTAFSQRIGNASPMLQGIGEDIVDRAKQRFATSTGPDGQRWAPNSVATMMSFISGLGKSARKKNGDLNKKGLQAVGSKKPLIGPSHDLERQIFWAVEGGDSLSIIASPVYAAIQQFGGKKSQFSHLWGDIPARPFLPIKEDGTLYPDEEKHVLDAINAYLDSARP